ncbi:hypothetical protein Tcan_18796 [Toxocara canis]|uniref:FLYWCH-type domain-containing protein n=1 Tax=Toxocara canis TaxID=6265 RepID=A0A0B2W2M5_TOXCA|nr:hypothetical protein Tcan_18796 [Toxocara canis]
MIKTLREWGTLVDPQYVTSQCGAQKLLIDGYSFICHRVSGSRTYWRCDWCQKSKCKSTVATEAGQTYLKDVPHNHPRSKNVSMVNRIYSHLKTAVSNSDEPVPEIVRRVLTENQWEQGSGNLPTFETMCRSMQRFRSRLRSGQRKLNPYFRGTQENTVAGHQPSYEPLAVACGYSLSNVFGNGCAVGVDNTQADQPNGDQSNAWNTISATSGSSAKFSGIGLMENVKEENGGGSAVVQSRKQEKKDEDAMNNESSYGDTFQHSLVTRFIEGYRQLCCVRRTAESSVSRKSVMAMFANSSETGSLPSEKMKDAKYDELQKYRLIEMPFLVDFVTKVFTEIAHFESDSKVSLFREFVPNLWLAEMGYLSLNSFNAESSSNRILVSMWQYIDEGSLSTFYETPDENAIRALRELLNAMLEHVIKPMNDTSFTNVDFVSLC